MRRCALALALAACAGESGTNLVVPEPAPPVPLPAPAVEAPPTPAPRPAEDHRLAIAHPAFEPTEGAPDVLVHLPASATRASPAHVVLFLHGYSGCVEVLAGEGDVACREGDRPHPGFGVVAAHDRAGTDTVLVLPQLAWMVRDGSPGRLVREGYARLLVEDALEGAGLSREIASVTLAAHSAAFESTLAVLRNGGLSDVLSSVVLLDALYSGGPAFLAWVEGGTEAAPRTLVSLYTGGTPRRVSEGLEPAALRALGDRLVVDPPSGADALRELRGPRRALFLHVRGAHGDVPRRHLSAVLASLGLPLRTAVPTTD